MNDAPCNTIPSGASSDCDVKRREGGQKLNFSKNSLEVPPKNENNII